MTYQTLLFETNGPVASITLNRPEKYNALHHQTRMDLIAVTEAIEENDSIRIAIIKANGAGFSAGGDLGDFGYDPISKMIDEEFKPFFETISKSNTLYIAQVHGSAAGIAAGLAMSCDFITMAEDANLYMAFAAIALVPDGANTWHLLRAMGYRRALETIVEGQKISAQDCLTYGIANKVFTAETLDEETQKWAQSLAKRAPLAVAAVKRLLRGSETLTFEQAISAEGLEQDHVLRSNDFKRGAEAFFSKKPPVFEGN